MIDEQYTKTSWDPVPHICPDIFPNTITPDIIPNTFTKTFSTWPAFDVDEFERSVYKLIMPEDIDILALIKKVIFHNPATVIYWKDGTKTVVKCGKKDVWDPEKGLAMAVVKKMMGNKGNYNKLFDKYIPQEQKNQQTVKDKFMQAADEYVKSLTENTDG